MAFQLLRNSTEWNLYQRQTAAELNMGGVEIAWGKGPQHYPCLVASTRLSEQRIVSAYTYVHDAQALLAAAMQMSEPSMRNVQGRQLVGEQTQKSGQSPPGHSQGDWNKDVAAQLLTLAYFMVETGICKPEEYEKKKVEMLAKVDQYSAEDMERLRHENMLGR